MSTTPEAPTATVGTHVHVLHRFGRDSEISLYHSYPAALAALATAVRADWSSITYRDDVPASPDGLSDAEAVLSYFGGNGGSGGPDAPTFGMSLDAGFVISEDVVAGPEPAAVSLRLGTLRVLDGDPADPDVPALTYCLDADGLTVAVFPGPDGHPTVLITPEAHMSGLPVTVRLEDPFQPGGFEQTHRVS
ncbi:hypothetical protein GCM10027258_80580 [Amycolatopsis stemonae]